MDVLVVTPEGSVPQRLFEAGLPALRRRGVRCTLATVSAEGPLHQRVRDDGTPAIAFGGAAMAVPGIARWLRANTVDLVHAHEVVGATVAGAAARLSRRDVPVIYHRHHDGGSARLRVASRAASALTQHTIAVSDAVRAAARRDDGSSADRITVAHNGVSALRSVGLDELTAVRARLGLVTDQPVVVLVARFRPEKGHLVLLEAMHALRQCTPEIALVLVGEGPTHDEVGAAARRTGGQIRLVGAQIDVAPWNALGDVVVVPSLSEPFGLAAIEAMSLGRPIVASRVGGLAEIITDGESGVLVPPGDSPALADGITRILEDESLATRLGQTARRVHGQLFTTDAMVDRWLAIYHRVLDGAHLA